MKASNFITEIELAVDPFARRKKTEKRNRPLYEDDHEDFFYSRKELENRYRRREKHKKSVEWA